MMDPDLKHYWLVIGESLAAFVGQAPGPVVAGQRALLADPYVFRVEIVPGQGGAVGFRRVVLPVELIAGHPSLPYEAIAIVPIAVRCLDELSGGERREMLVMLENAENMRAQARAAKSGILVASALPKA